MQKFAAGQFPETNGTARFAGGGTIAVGADRDNAYRPLGTGDRSKPHIARPLPQLHFAKTSRSQQIARRLKRQRLHQIHVSDARSAVARLARQRRIDQPGDPGAGADAVDINLIVAAAGGQLAVGRNGHRENRPHRRRQLLPVHRRRGASHLAGGPLIDPQLDQAKLVGRERDGFDVVVVRRHRRVVEMRGGYEQQAVAAFVGHDGRAAVAPFQDRLRRFENQMVFGLGAIVASDAIVPQHRQHFALKIDRCPDA